jgi:transcriptional regulatory protein LevR
MEAFPSAETLAKVVKKLKVEKYEKIFEKLTNRGWWNKINLVKRELTNAMIDFMQVELKFPYDRVESEVDEQNEPEEAKIEDSNPLAYRFANAMAKSIMNKIAAKTPADRLKEQE